MTSQNRNIKEQFLTVKIERLVPDGYGLGFADGLTVFVPLTAAGDLVKAKIDRQKGTVAFATLVEILEPSADRIVPLCQYFGRCGGCDFQQMNYEAQLKAKAGIIKDALRRIGKIDWPEKIEIVPSPSEWNYRTRVNWKRDKSNLGYFERSSHRVIDVETCPILATLLQNELSRQRENLAGKNSAELQAVSSDNEISRRDGRQYGVFDENFYAANHEAAELEKDISADIGKAREICLKVGDFDYAFSAATFFQVNHSLLTAFVKTAIGAARGNSALDLYCGVGLFSLPLAKRFSEVKGIEGNPNSVELARKNVHQAGLTNVNFETALVGQWLANKSATLPPLDFVLLDPPRTGAERQTIASLLKIEPLQIVYVSCNPATLARDLRLLLETGVYQIEQITAFDFFPQTHHVETIVHLRKAVKSTKPCEREEAF